MALQGWNQEKNRLADENKRLRTIASQLMIAGGNPGGIPNRPYDAPKEDPKNPYVPAPSRKLASANNIRRTGGPLGENDNGYGENPTPGHPDWQLAGGPQLPNFKPMGRVIEGTRKGVLPMNETKIKQPLQIKQAMNYPPPTQLDEWLKLYQGPGGSLRHIEDPDLRKLILQRGAMRADAANNIRSLQSSGHQTVLDDNRPGKLKIIKQFRPPRA